MGLGMAGAWVVIVLVALLGGAGGLFATFGGVRHIPGARERDLAVKAAAAFWVLAAAYVLALWLVPRGSTWQVLIIAYAFVLAALAMECARTPFPLRRGQTGTRV
jgi:hypothetical protein